MLKSYLVKIDLISYITLLRVFFSLVERSSSQGQIKTCCLERCSILAVWRGVQYLLHREVKNTCIPENVENT